MLIVGLTGGIGSGKSTIAKHFAALGVPIIDADQLAHDLVAPNQPALQEIVQAFGPQILTSTGDLDRSAVRQRVFSDNSERTQLENILHPRIRAAMQAQIRHLEALSVTYIILVIPLLLETQQSDLCDRILVIDIPTALQIERVQDRNGYAADEIRAIMDKQCDRAYRLAMADDIIDNSADTEHLLTQVDVLHEYYISITNNYIPTTTC